MFAFLRRPCAGLLHVFSGPDHLAAVAPLAADRRRRNQWRTGLQWGVGHTAGVVLIAPAAAVVREQLPLDAISAYSERIVGVALIVGVWGLWGARQCAHRVACALACRRVVCDGHLSRPCRQLAPVRRPSGACVCRADGFDSLSGRFWRRRDRRDDGVCRRRGLVAVRFGGGHSAAIAVCFTPRSPRRSSSAVSGWSGPLPSSPSSCPAFSRPSS